MHYSPVNNKKITCAITRTRDLWTVETRKCFVNDDIVYRITAKLREAFLFQVPNSFGIFLISFAILKNPFANPLKKVANLLMEFAMFLS